MSSDATSSSASLPTYKIAIAGASGRMGRMLIEAVQAADDAVLAGALDVPTSPAIGMDATAFSGQRSGVLITADLQEGLKGADFLIDFTRPEGTLAHLKVCREFGVKAVIGTTGFTPEQLAEVRDAARDVAIVMAPNMSVGVNVVLKLLDMAARALAEGYDIEIVEAHHRHKVDAPSGTALKMGEVVAESLGRTLKEHGVFERVGQCGPRSDKEIGFATLRGGEEVGVHTVFFAAAGERLELTHRSFSREGYAAGAVRGALWLKGKKPGLYGMKDVLGL